MYEAAKAKPTAAQLYIKEVADVTGRKESTVKMWVYGIQRPDADTMFLLSEHFGVPIETLFPKQPKTFEQ